jgi:hypothetical protein
LPADERLDGRMARSPKLPNLTPIFEKHPAGMPVFSIPASHGAGELI